MDGIIKPTFIARVLAKSFVDAGYLARVLLRSRARLLEGCSCKDQVEIAIGVVKNLPESLPAKIPPCIDISLGDQAAAKQVEKVRAEKREGVWTKCSYQP
jgi:hypothetical protein